MSPMKRVAQGALAVLVVLGGAAPAAAASAQTIAFTLPAYVFGGTRAAPLVLNGKASSGLAVTYDVTTPATCLLDGSTLTPLAVGTCTVTASQGGDATWAAAVPVSRSMEIVTSAIRITFDQSFTVNGETRLSVPLVVPARTLVSMSVTTGEATMANKTVEVWARYSPTGRWTKVAYRSIDRTTLSATYRFFARPWAQYRWRFGGAGVLHDAWSQTRTVIGG